MRWKLEVSISTGLEMVPGCDGQTDGQTDRITIATIALAHKNVLHFKTILWNIVKYFFGKMPLAELKIKD